MQSVQLIRTFVAFLNNLVCSLWSACAGLLDLRLAPIPVILRRFRLFSERVSVVFLVAVSFDVYLPYIHGCDSELNHELTQNLFFCLSHELI